MMPVLIACPDCAPLRRRASALMAVPIFLSGEARILVGRRRLITYVVEPARALRERAFVE